MCNEHTGAAAAAAGSVRAAVEPLEQRQMLSASVSAASIGGHYEDSARSVFVDRKGQTYLAGAFAGAVDFDPGAGAYVLDSGSKSRPNQRLAYVARYGADGAPVWVRAFDDRGVTVTQVEADSAGHVYVAGTFVNRADLDPSRRQLILKTGKDSGFVAKFTAAGKLVWARAIGTGARIAVDAAGDVFAARFAFDGFDAGLGVTGPAPQTPYNLVKLDSAGKFVWGGHVDAGVSDLVAGRRGGVFLTGSVSGPGADVDPGPGVLVLAAHGRTAAYAAAVRADGQLDWATIDSDALPTAGAAITVDPWDGVIVAGTRTRRSTRVLGDHPTDLVVEKFDPSGRLVWSSGSTGGSVHEVRAVDADAEGNVAVGGTYEYANDVDLTALDFDRGAGAAHASVVGEVFVARYDAGGAFRDVASAGNFDGSMLGIQLYDLAVGPGGAVRAVGEAGGTFDMDAGPGVTTLRTATPARGAMELQGDAYVWDVRY